MKRTLSVLGIAGTMLVAMVLSQGYGYAKDKTTKQATTKTQTFVGEMQGTNENREWTEPILYDKALSANYYVDDWKADRYIGHQVKITGTLDQKNGVIHPESIEVLD